MHSVIPIAFLCLSLLMTGIADAQEWRPLPLVSEVTGVSPMTGLVFWADRPQADTDAIQLEFSYMLYRDVVNAEGQYDWSEVDALLDRIASRGHQAILRFRFIYPGDTTTAVPDSIRNLPDYRELLAESEGRPTAFCDWSHPALRAFAKEFHARFAKRYDDDPRLAFVQTGFGLWAEYHIYDGPMELGKTFPSKAYQAEYLTHLDSVYRKTPWSISIDAAEQVRTPFAEQPELKRLRFGLFDDSFMHETHHEYNLRCWTFFARDRFLSHPAGGEFSYYNAHDQRTSLAPTGPHGERFEDAAKRFGLSYIMANDQPRYQPIERIREAGMAMGYRFRVVAFETNGTQSRLTIENVGIAPIYYDAYPAIDGVRSLDSLKGLNPGQQAVFGVATDGEGGQVTIACDRLVPGQEIGFEADLTTP